MMQIAAMLNDSLRELRSRSLFWITLHISIAVPLILFGVIGFDSRGWHVLWFATVESEVLRAGAPATAELVRWLFGGALLWWWLTLGAVVVALIASAGAIPGFVASGSIDLVLAKPLGRARLLLAKILAVLLFMLVQLTVSVGVAYLLAGFRFGIWFHAAWLALPLVLLQFLYLYAVMALAGLWTRSALASLLIVFLFWGLVSIVQFASNQLDRSTTEARAMIQQTEQRIAETRAKAEADGRELTQWEQSRITGLQAQVDPVRDILGALEPWRKPINALELCVPKTGDIQKIVADRIEAPTLQELTLRLQGLDSNTLARMSGMADREEFEEMQKVGVAGSRAVRAVDPLMSIGTSLIFTAGVLALSIALFLRRDF